jgi:hypothetical protein
VRDGLERLPGGELIALGLTELAAGLDSVPALLVSIGATRLRSLGLAVPAGPDHPEHRLYERLASEDADSAHTRYNALIRRLVSFERALACVG